MCTTVTFLSVLLVPVCTSIVPVHVIHVPYLWYMYMYGRAVHVHVRYARDACTCSAAASVLPKQLFILTRLSLSIRSLAHRLPTPVRYVVSAFQHGIHGEIT